MNELYQLRMQTIAKFLKVRLREIRICCPLLDSDNAFQLLKTNNGKG